MSTLAFCPKADCAPPRLAVPCSRPPDTANDALADAERLFLHALVQTITMLPAFGFLDAWQQLEAHLHAILYAVIAEGIGQDRDAARHRASPVLVCESHCSKGIMTICE